MLEQARCLPIKYPYYKELYSKRKTTTHLKAVINYLKLKDNQRSVYLYVYYCGA